MKNLNIKISPSILAADVLRLEDEMKRAKAAGADMLHCDVMDGVYVPNISFGFDFIKSVGTVTDLPLDVHMMTVKPGAYIKELKACGADIVTIHHDIADEETVKNILRDIRKAGMKTGLSLRPMFPAEDILPFADLVDMVLVMTVEPGFGGQKFMADMLPKIEKLRVMLPDVDIQVDGGINAETAALCAEAGANIFVAGTFAFRAPDMKEAVGNIKESAKASFCEVK